MPELILKLPRPHKTQQEVLNSKVRFKTLRCGRRWGKSIIGQDASIRDLLKNKRVAYITPTFGLAEYFFKQELMPMLPPIFKTNSSALNIKLNDGIIQFFSSEALKNMRGQKFHKVIWDEAAYAYNLQEDWENVVRPTLTDYKGDALFVSTPRGFDYYHSLCEKDHPDWQNFHFSTYDNPHIDVQEIEDARLMLPHAVFEQEYMANPMQNADNPFGSDNIKACIIPEMSKKPAKFFGIDLAKSSDYTVILGLDEDGNLAHFERFQKSWGETKEIISKLPKRTMGYIDATGVGDPIAEEVCQILPKLEPFKFTSPSKQELIRGLISSIAQKLLGFTDGVITKELDTFEYVITPTHVKYEARKGFHDDTTIALALADKSRRDMFGKGKYIIR